MAPQPLSLRRQLLIGILLPVFVIVLINTVSLYRQALRAADTAYDRTLLASAKSIGELLELVAVNRIVQEVREAREETELAADQVGVGSRHFARAGATPLPGQAIAIGAPAIGTIDRIEAAKRAIVKMSHNLPSWLWPSRSSCGVGVTTSTHTATVTATGHLNPASLAVSDMSTSTPSAIACSLV